MISFDNYDFTVVSRFVQYAKIDTQSDPNSPTTPSTEKQKNLGNRLVEELISMGIKNAELDEHGYVYATLPSNSSKNIPTICFCSHMDTSPDCSGENVNPILHKNYDGKDIVLPKDSTQAILITRTRAKQKKENNDSKKEI